jgi:hypothetical protein
LPARLLALREAVLHGAPYGFRATWHHLVVNQRIPVRLEDDPDSLQRALDEVEEAREPLRERREAFAARRRQEKAEGRAVRAADRWLTWSWLAYCPDFERHPTDRLLVVVGGVLDAYEGQGVDPRCCAVCGAVRALDSPCPRCGVFSGELRHLRRTRVPGGAERWQLTWQRRV